MPICAPNWIKEVTIQTCRRTKAMEKRLDALVAALELVGAEEMTGSAFRDLVGSSCWIDERGISE